MYRYAHTHAGKHIQMHRTTKPLAAVHAIEFGGPMHTHTQLNISNPQVEPILFYFCESWTLIRTLDKTLDGIHVYVYMSRVNVNH